MLKEVVLMKSREIGSEFWNIPINEKENDFFGNEINWFISGRAALDYIIKDIKSSKDVKTIAMPSWCCDTMIEPALKNGLEVLFYPVVIKNNNKLVKEITIQADILLKLDYFGYEKTTIKFEGIKINDVSHSLFIDKCNFDDDYVFGSLRKWAGFKTGGFAYSKKGFSIKPLNKTNLNYIDLRILAMKEKEKYVDGLINSKDYLSFFSNAECMLDELYECYGYEKDIDDAKHLDIELIKNKRQENAKTLLRYVKKYAVFKEVKEFDCPLFVPIIVPNNKRNDLRKYLIKNNVYCPIHWPISKLHKLNEEEQFIYDNELSLVCDQRYNLEDMEYIGELVEDYLC